MSDVVVCGVSAYTPIGLSASEVGFLYRAGATGLRESPVPGADGNAFTMGVVPTLPPDTLGAARLSALASAAGRLFGVRGQLAVLVEEWHGQPNTDGSVAAQTLSDGLRAEARALFGDENGSVEVWALGAGGSGQVLQRAVQALNDGSLEVVVLGGAHSDCDFERVARLGAEERIFSSENRDGLLLGEAASFVVLCRGDVARRLRLSVLARLLTFASGFETARPDNDESAFEARGLTAAVHSALRALPGARVGWVLSDLNLEVFRNYEFQALLTRSQKYLCEPQVFDAPAQRLGHLGAAALPLHLTLGAEAWRRGYAPFPLLLSTTGSDSGARTAVVVQDATRTG